MRATEFTPLNGLNSSRSSSSSTAAVACDERYATAAAGGGVEADDVMYNHADTSCATDNAHTSLPLHKRAPWIGYGLVVITAFCWVSFAIIGNNQQAIEEETSQHHTWSAATALYDPRIIITTHPSEMQPFSTIHPKDLGMRPIDRPESSRPSEAWGPLRMASKIGLTSLDTNIWWENIVLGDPTQEGPANTIAAIPYTFDASGPTPGLLIHFPHLRASDLAVITEYDWRRHLHLGCIGDVGSHTVSTPGPLAITLLWESKTEKGAAMTSPIVRGSPYGTMEYFDMKPQISSIQAVRNLTVDGIPAVCGESEPASIFVKKEFEIVFWGSDATWLVFVSEPTSFSCFMEYRKERGDPPVPGALGPWVLMPHFSMTAETTWKKGVVRAALANNCTTGVSEVHCDHVNGRLVARNNEQYANLLRTHSMMYPTGESRVGYMTGNEGGWVWDITKEREDAGDGDTGVFLASPPSIATLRFIWERKRMDGKFIDESQRVSVDNPSQPNAVHQNEQDKLLMFALPHHLEALDVEGVTAGGTPTLHGFSRLVKGSIWDMKVPLPAVKFMADDPIRPEMLADIHTALDVDMDFQIPDNYQRGAGDTYFSGKILAKMARIALIAEEIGRHDDAMIMAQRMIDGIDVWYNGKAESPLVYDYWWGGVFSCGCDYDGETESCANDYKNLECPAVSDVGQNFGAGFHNDKHFHYGYHIYAAAVGAKFYPDWGRASFEYVLTLIRDIANPSSADPYFPQFRHKDWYLGSSWAMGIVTLGGVPYPNGRNQESSSEAVHAYDAVTLYGQVMTDVFALAGDAAGSNTASHIRATGRMLTAMEIRSAQAYWHVRDEGAPGVARVYPPAYKPHVVGMLWSTLAQMQTWFGSEAWKVYGIQILPLTAVSGRLLEKEWVSIMLKDFRDSCIPDGDVGNLDTQCINQGWSVLVHACEAIIGNWQEAWTSVQGLPDSVFEGPGGDGHSRTNTLWYIATRGEARD